MAGIKISAAIVTEAHQKFLMHALPYLLEPETLVKNLDALDILIVYLGKYEQFLNAHIPSSRYLDPQKLNRGTMPAKGLLPEIADIESAFRSIGLESHHHVVCYDEIAGTAAARMCWVLETMGHTRVSFINGGFTAWQSANLPIESGEVIVQQSHWLAKPNPATIADKTYILAAINDANDNIQILDSRSPEEYNGLKSASDRRGHIPTAVNLDWLATIDSDRRLKPSAELHRMLDDLGLNSSQEIIVHCQTHQRSSHSFVMLRALGYENVRGYAGAWAEWAADESLPIC